MRYFKLIFLTLCIAGLALSCKKKDYPEPAVLNSPQFSFTGTVGGQAVTIEAGVNDYYMNTSYTQNANQVYEFIGNLKQTSCASCKGLRIRILNSRVSATGASSMVDSGLVAGAYYPFMHGGTPQSLWSQVQFYGYSSSPATAAYAWDFGDGTTSTLQNPTHLFMSGPRSVCLSVTDTSCSSNACGQFIVRSDTSLFTSIRTVGTSTSNTVFFQDTTMGYGPFSYLWSWGDGSGNTVGSGGIQPHTFPGPGVYQVNLLAGDTHGDTAIAQYNVQVQFGGSCATQAHYEIASVTSAPNPLGFSNVVIEWTDDAGNVYTSDNSSQPSISYFQILSVENYQNNAGGQMTKRVHARFSCLVYNGLGSLGITDAEVWFGFAYK